jgi:hypothetical protein
MRYPCVFLSVCFSHMLRATRSREEGRQTSVGAAKRLKQLSHLNRIIIMSTTTETTAVPVTREIRFS